MLRDLRHSVRLLRRTPGFTSVAVLVLALGIGANTAVFSLVNALVLQPRQGRIDQVVGVFSRDRAKPDHYRDFSYPAYLDMRERGDIFDSLMAHTFSTVGITQGDVTKQTFASIVSANYFSTLGVRMAAGRAFTVEEERPGSGSRVAIASYAAWRRAGLDPAFVGSTVRGERHGLHSGRRGAARLRRHDDAGVARVVVSARQLRHDRQRDVQAARDRLDRSRSTTP